jgi:hypothetical protein
MRSHLIGLLTSSFLLPVIADAQSNTVAGLEGRLTDVGEPTYFGRRGAAYPNGEIGMAISYYMCNSGTVPLPWLEAGNPPQPMATNHPKFAFLVARATTDRIVQITDTRTYVKHAHGASNSNGACGTCQSTGTSQSLGVHCQDAYSANTNQNRLWLGPADEIDPWTGVWHPIGSYFDRGDPPVASPANSDGVRSLTSGTFSDPVKNRITLREADLLLPGTFLYAEHMVIEGEAGDRHLDNLGWRQMTPAWNGSTWSFTNPTSGPTIGSVLDAWPGAVVNHARNGNDDGNFFVAVKVTPAATAGLYHYEYAVHDVDNGRGAAGLRIPVDSTAAVQNVGFRDLDTDPLDDWTWSRFGGELWFQAGSNALQWNQIFNFWFDCDVAPASGTVAIDEALPGPGALQVVVASQVPATAAAVTGLGPGCGTPSPTLGAVGRPVLPNPAFALALTSTPNAVMILLAALNPAAIVLAPGCTDQVDPATLVVGGVVQATTGSASVPLALPGTPVLAGLSLYLQAVQVVTGGPVFGQFSLSNALSLRAGLF